MIKKACLKRKKMESCGKGAGTAVLGALLLLFLSAIPSATASSSEQASPLPKAESVLDSFVEKCGGRAVFDKIDNRHTTSTMTLSVFPAPAEVTTTVTRQGAFRCIVSSPAFGRIEYGSDGQTVWEIVPMTGPRIKEGLERSRFRALYGLDLPMRWRDVFKKVDVSGLDAVEEKPAYKLTAVTPEDYPITYYFDQASGLLVKILYPMETVTGQGIQEIVLSDYRNVGGILFPFLQIRKESGREMKLAFAAVEFNVDVPVGTFALPEPILKIRKSGI